MHKATTKPYTKKMNQEEPQHTALEIHSQSKQTAEDDEVGL